MPWQMQKRYWVTADSTAAAYSQAYTNLTNVAAQLETTKDKLTRVLTGYQNFDTTGYSEGSIANYQKQVKEAEELLKKKVQQEQILPEHWRT